MLEIERKFLVKDLSTVNLSVLRCLNITQWYISFDPVVRVRISDDTAYLTIKGKGAVSKLEIEHTIPLADAVDLMELQKGSKVRKKRYIYPHEGRDWEIDVFEDDNQGLILAEIELDDEHEKFPKPSFIGREVSFSKGYSNASLAKKPRKK